MLTVRKMCFREALNNVNIESKKNLKIICAQKLIYNYFKI